jgi:hypothetical protein
MKYTLYMVKIIASHELKYQTSILFLAKTNSLHQAQQ